MEKNSQNVRNALCYIPLVAFVLYFTEENKSKEFERHLRYWMILFVVFVVCSFLFRSIIATLVFLVYIWVSVFLWYKAYNWDDVKVEFVDDFLEKKDKEREAKKTNSDKNEAVKEEIDVLEEIGEKKDLEK